MTTTFEFVFDLPSHLSYFTIHITDSPPHLQNFEVIEINYIIIIVHLRELSLYLRATELSFT